MTNGLMAPAVLLDTIAHERYARGALLLTFLDDLRLLAHDRAPESTRLLGRAETLTDDEVDVVVDELRSVCLTEP